MNTLVIGDTHIPFEHPGYLDFCRDTAKKYACKRITHVGDIVDNHAISFHDHDPDGYSAGKELEKARIRLKKWSKAFPHVDCAIGNHDALGQRKLYAMGVPMAYLRSFGEVLELPKGWRFDFEWKYGNWRVTHGTGSNGHDAAFKRSISHRISTAQGHIHTAAGVKFHASTSDIIWGMQVGCGINRRAYAFNYGRDFADKPILGCGVVLENGKVPLFEPMPM